MYCILNKMKFCNLCNNFVYIQLDKENNLQYHCKNCDNVIENTDTKSLCVIDNNYMDDKTVYKQYINKYLKYDPTLPRVNNIQCPNQECKTKKENVENEVIFVKYDSTNMKYMYHCVHCDHFWKNE